LIANISALEIKEKQTVYIFKHF